MSVKFNSNKDDVLKSLENGILNGLTAVGMFVGGEAQLRAPVDTGDLRDSILFEVDEGDKSVTIGTNVEHGLWVEKGTSKMDAQPYLNPAIEENHGRAKSLFAQAAKL